MKILIVFMRYHRKYDGKIINFSFGKARELTNLSKYEFGLLVGRRDIPRHYGLEELQDDIAYARGE